MNGRRSRLRRRERARARAAGEIRQNENPDDIVVRLRQVRDQRLADNGRRRSHDLAQLETFYAEERREIWAGYHSILEAIRQGKKITFAEPQVVEEDAPQPRTSWFRRLFRRQGRVELAETLNGYGFSAQGPVR